MDEVEDNLLSMETDIVLARALAKSFLFSDLPEELHGIITNHVRSVYTVWVMICRAKTLVARRHLLAMPDVSAVNQSRIDRLDGRIADLMDDISEYTIAVAESAKAAAKVIKQFDHEESNRWRSS